MLPCSECLRRPGCDTGIRMQEANSTYDWPTGMTETLFAASIIWAVSVVEMLACDRSLTHDRQHNSGISNVTVIIADKLDRHQLVLTNVSATAHVSKWHLIQTLTSRQPEQHCGESKKPRAGPGTKWRRVSTILKYSTASRGSIIYVLTSSRTPRR